MLRQLDRFRDGRAGKVKLGLVASVALALVIAPLAVAQTTGLIGGKRNPSSGSFKAETKVIASNDTWGMRYSNRAVGGGGGLLFGCRSEPGGTPQRNYPCARSRNVANGLAFEFLTAGSLVGTITAGRGGDNTKPFTTNATGVATGLNAERVGSQTPAQLTSAAVNAVQGTLSFARVSAEGTSNGVRGVSGVSRVSTGTYAVTFANPVNACSLTATQSAAGTDVGTVGTQLGADNRTVTVSTLSLLPAPELADRPFHISAVC
ncbi:MAG TPA: hypothetical protein VEX36_09470 [Thermoleophilaceae bacterium]|nr:hypothetical protein [Thermoleophilaceae bacterium]